MSQFHPSVIFSLLVTGQQVVKGSFSMDPDACILDLMLLSSNDASDEKFIIIKQQLLAFKTFR